MKVFSLVFVSLWLSVCALAQQPTSYTLDIQSFEDSKLPNYRSSFKSKTQRAQALAKFLRFYWQDGYLTAHYEKTDSMENHLTAVFSKGPKYTWANIKPGNVPPELLEESGWNARHYKDKPIEPADVADIHEKLIAYFENNGYPFAKVRLDSLQEENGTLTASLNLDRGGFFKIDSILLKGNVEISQKYIENYINVKSGDPYNESIVSQVDQRLSEIPFINSLRPMELVFSPGKVRVYIYIERKKSSDINAILGLLPDENTGQINWVGDARLRLKNALNRGELIDFNVRRLLNLTTDLQVNFNYPFIFNTDFGTDFNLQVYRRDTTFLEVRRALALQYILPGGNYLEAFIDRSESSLLTDPTILSPTALASLGDMAITSYGLGFRKDKYDYRFNPQRGYGTFLKASLGNKQIIKNNDYPDSFYDDIELRSTQFRLHTIMDAALPIKRKSAIYMKLAGGTFMNANILQNELFRIGGIHTLRGFDVESIFATTYGIFTFEYRYLLERNSRWYVFSDIARYERNIIGEYTNDTPLGFGTGMSFQTGAGIFSISYALGREQGNPILLRASRVHFGFVNFF